MEVPKPKKKFKFLEENQERFQVSTRTVSQQTMPMREKQEKEASSQKRKMQIVPYKVISIQFDGYMEEQGSEEQILQDSVENQEKFNFLTYWLGGTNCCNEKQILQQSIIPQMKGEEEKIPKETLRVTNYSNDKEKISREVTQVLLQIDGQQKLIQTQFVRSKKSIQDNTKEGYLSWPQNFLATIGNCILGDAIDTEEKQLELRFQRIWAKGRTGMLELKRFKVLKCFNLVPTTIQEIPKECLGYCECVLQKRGKFIKGKILIFSDIQSSYSYIRQTEQQQYQEESIISAQIEIQTINRVNQIKEKSKKKKKLTFQEDNCLTNDCGKQYRFRHQEKKIRSFLEKFDEIEKQLESNQQDVEPVKSVLVRRLFQLKKDRLSNGYRQKDLI